MQAFNNDQAIKDRYLARVQAHRLADEIVKGKYWQDGKGCAIGCTVHSADHTSYETELGIPTWLARVEDIIFEGLPNEEAKLWPEQFLSAIKPGVDLNSVKTSFIIFILESSIESMMSAKYDADKFPEIRRVIEQSEIAILEVIKCHRDGSDISAATNAMWSAASAADAAWNAAASAPRSAAANAANAAASAADSAAASAVESTPASVAWSVAATNAMWSAAPTNAAWSAATSAANAAASTLWANATTSTATANAVWSAATSAAYTKYAHKLLQLLKECN